MLCDFIVTIEDGNQNLDLNPDDNVAVDFYTKYKDETSTIDISGNNVSFKNHINEFLKEYNNYIFKNLFKKEYPENIKLTQMISRVVENTSLNNNTNLLFKDNQNDNIKTYIQNPNIFMNTDYNEYISNDLLPESEVGIKSTYSFWIYFSNVPENAHWVNDYNEAKPIIFRYGTPDVVYLPKHHQLKLSFTYKNPSNIKTKYDFILKDLEVQKWMNIIMVMNNRNIDIY